MPLFLISKAKVICEKGLTASDDFIQFLNKSLANDEHRAILEVITLFLLICFWYFFMAF